MFALGGANLTRGRLALNHRPADLLTILANLCDYEIRLSTNEIEKRFKSLSLYLVALAIINEDLSLLAPGVYDNWRIQGI